MSYNQQKCLAAEILTALSIVAFVAMVGIAFIMNKRNREPEYSSTSCEGESCLSLTDQSRELWNNLEPTRGAYIQVFGEEAANRSASIQMLAHGQIVFKLKPNGEIELPGQMVVDDRAKAFIDAVKYNWPSFCK